MDGLSFSKSDSILGLPDPDDEPFLDIALVASAHYLVTGNMADYPPDKCHGICIRSPADFMLEWRRLHPSPGNPAL
jgi:predicted nucleic acid-binding protein